MDVNVMHLGTLLTLIAASIVSAVAASGLTAAALLLFFRSLLNSPAAIKLVEGLVDSFPPQTRELIHVMAQFFEVVSEDGTAPLTQPSDRTPATVNEN
jgi:hypothetical protein